MLGVGSVQDHPVQGSAGMLHRIISTQEHHCSICVPVLASPSSAHHNSDPNNRQGMAAFVLFLLKPLLAFRLLGEDMHTKP